MSKTTLITGAGTGIGKDAAKEAQIALFGALDLCGAGPVASHLRRVRWNDSESEERLMHLAWRIAAGVPAAVFISVGLAWLVAPEFISARMRMPLLEGDGLSTQIGDLAAFFLALGAAMVVALWTNRSVWLYPPIMLLVLAATGRVIAWLAHGAGLPFDMIVVELVVAGLLIVLARKMAAAGAAAKLGEVL